MTTDLTRVSWPAVIAHRDDPELVYIADLASWTGDDDLCRWRYDIDDRLIDSNGECFSLSFDREHNITRLVSTGERITLERFATMIRQHMFALAQTCVSKVELRDFADGFSSLQMLERGS